MEYKRIIINILEGMEEKKEESFLRMLYTITIRHVGKNSTLDKRSKGENELDAGKQVIYSN